MDIFSKKNMGSLDKTEPLNQKNMNSKSSRKAQLKPLASHVLIEAYGYPPPQGYGYGGYPPMPMPPRLRVFAK